MARLDIVQWPDPVLAEVCERVQAIDPSIRSLATDMLETMYAAEGRGLAAPQVGRSLRMFVMDPAWKEREPDPLICINPEVTWSSTEMRDNREACLSIPGISADIRRPAQVHMRWRTLDGSMREADLAGFAAVCAQHEMDHLDGIVTLDRVDGQTRLALIEEYTA